ncbi:MAG: hypothetical protein IPP35_07125 [Elusimicrobia bacterium]|nr:hypothetical protein [Elusimicrobiota bacterium]
MPPHIEKAIAKLHRFNHLEIGDISPLPPIHSPPKGDPCGHCGQANEPGRTFCWACYKPLKGAPPSLKEEVFTVVVNGATYRSDQPDLAAPIQRLMDRVRRDGYSPKVAAQWAAAEGKEITNASEFETRAAEKPGVSIVRVDDQVYRSDDPALPPEMRTLLDYLRTHAVTPELMERLRRAGAQVKYRPANTLSPSDGDLDFWSTVRRKTNAPAVPSPASGGLTIDSASLWKWIPRVIGAVIFLYLLKNGCR